MTDNCGPSALPDARPTYKIPTRERVHDGAKLLDEKFPGWWDKIEVHLLNLDSYTECVLGQIFGTWSAGLSQVSDNVLLLADFSDRHAFSVPCQCYEEPSYHAAHDREEMDKEGLEYAWKDEVLSRRHPVGVGK